MEKRNEILEQSFDFALMTVDFAAKLQKEGHFEIKSQFIRSGTSIGANVHESQFASSTADFLNELRIARKEGNESNF